MEGMNKNEITFNYGISKFEGGVHKQLGQDSFNFISLKGQGAFGKVYEVSIQYILFMCGLFVNLLGY